MAILSNVVYKFNEITIKILMSFFTELVGEKHQRINMKPQNTTHTRAITRKKHNWKYYILSGQ